MKTDILIAIISVVGAILTTVISISLPILFKRLEKAERKLKNLIIYRPGAIAYSLIEKINGKENLIYDDGNKDQKRNLNLLLDEGFLRPADGNSYIHFSNEYNGKKIYDIVSLTVIGEQLIRYRSKLNSR